jgi:hypothetical protein
VRLEKTFLKDQLDLNLSDEEIASLRADGFTSAQAQRECQRIGHLAAHKSVRDDDFPPLFDVRLEQI